MNSNEDVLVRAYTYEDELEWDHFIIKSRNGTFLHMRSYLGYHSDRFPDASLMLYVRGRLIALLPATALESVLYSHRGLTYGGLIVGRDFHATDAIPTFKAIVNWALTKELTSLIYKPSPHIYHKMPAEEDLYAINCAGGRLVRRDLSTALLLSDRYSYSKGRKAAIKKALSGSIKVKVSEDYESFMTIEARHLADKHGVLPVHNASEIKLLADSFPANIKLTAAFEDHYMLGGVLTYTTNVVCHAQYIGATIEGKKMGALDACIHNILNSMPAGVRWFDFGISTTDEGRQLDEALLGNKESWGGRSIMYDQYEMVF
jgi:hypothetical protein